MSGDALTLGQVVGDVGDPFPSSVPLKIFYNNRLLFNGAELKPSAVVNRPSIDVGGDDLRTFYTLVMVNPDAPNPNNPTLREYLHWCALTGAWRALMTYESPGPVFGIHRMVFGLFRQLGRETVFAPLTRNNFNTTDFAQEQFLKFFQTFITQTYHPLCS